MSVDSTTSSSDALEQGKLLLRPGDTLSHFRIKGELGRGAMGVVVLAEDALLHRDVALKILKRRDDSDKARIYFEQFLREARSAARLVHPHIVQIFEINTDAGNTFIAMEYLDGGNLHAYVKTNGPLDVPTACRYAAEMAEALAYAHERGVTHRDIKPANVMLVAHRSNGGHIKVADFGLATIADPNDDFEYPWKVVGSPYYMAPELAQGLASPQSDIFALGGVLWFLLTGKPPFPLKKARDFKRVHTEIPLPSLRTLCIDAPLQLAAICEKALAREPSDRYATAAEMAQQLQALAGGFGQMRLVIAAAVPTPIPTAPSVEQAQTIEPRTHTDSSRLTRWRAMMAIALVDVAIGVTALMSLRSDRPAGPPPSTPTASEPAPPSMEPTPPITVAKVETTSPSTPAIEQAPDTAEGISAPGLVADEEETPLPEPAKVAAAIPIEPEARPVTSGVLASVAGVDPAPDRPWPTLRAALDSGDIYALNGDDGWARLYRSLATDGAGRRLIAGTFSNVTVAPDASWRIEVRRLKQSSMIIRVPPAITKALPESWRNASKWSNVLAQGRVSLSATGTEMEVRRPEDLMVFARRELPLTMHDEMELRTMVTFRRKVTIIAPVVKVVAGGSDRHLRMNDGPGPGLNVITSATVWAGMTTQAEYHTPTPTNPLLVGVTGFLRFDEAIRRFDIEVLEAKDLHIESMDHYEEALAKSREFTSAADRVRGATTDSTSLDPTSSTLTSTSQLQAFPTPPWINIDLPARQRDAIIRCAEMALPITIRGKIMSADQQTQRRLRLQFVDANDPRDLVVFVNYSTWRSLRDDFAKAVVEGGDLLGRHVRVRGIPLYTPESGGLTMIIHDMSAVSLDTQPAANPANEPEIPFVLTAPKFDMVKLLREADAHRHVNVDGIVDQVTRGGDHPLVRFRELPHEGEVIFRIHLKEMSGRNAFTAALLAGQDVRGYVVRLSGIAERVAAERDVLISVTDEDDVRVLGRIEIPQTTIERPQPQKTASSHGASDSSSDIVAPTAAPPQDVDPDDEVRLKELVQQPPASSVRVSGKVLKIVRANNGIVVLLSNRTLLHGFVHPDAVGWFEIKYGELGEKLRDREVAITGLLVQGLNRAPSIVIHRPTDLAAPTD